MYSELNLIGRKMDFWTTTNNSSLKCSPEIKNKSRMLVTIRKIITTCVNAGDTTVSVVISPSQKRWNRTKIDRKDKKDSQEYRMVSVKRVTKQAVQSRRRWPKIWQLSVKPLMIWRKWIGMAIHHFTYTLPRRSQIELAVGEFKIKSVF